MNPTFSLDRDPSDFAIEIDFVPNTEDPARVFRAMTGLIDACNRTDQQLIATFGTSVRSVLLLQNIEAGSVKTWLRSKVEAVEDDVLKSGDWRKALGLFLVKGKYKYLEYTAEHRTIESAKHIYNLQDAIGEAAKETGVPIVRDPPIPAREVAESLRLLAGSTDPLQQGDTALYIDIHGDIPINTSFEVTAERIEELLTVETILNRVEMILCIKKPDFLGDSMWDFRHEGKKLPAKILDDQWMKSFREGDVTLRPGDAIRGRVEVATKYGTDTEVIATHYKILKVEEILRRASIR